VREASLLGGFARSFLESAKAKQQQAYQTKMMQNVDQQIAASKQAGTLAQAESNRQQMATDQAQGLYNRNLEALKGMQTTLKNADAMRVGTVPVIAGDPTMRTGPASFGLSNTIPRPLSASAPARSEDPFRPYVPPPASQVPNSPLRSGITTPTSNVNVLEDFRNSMKDINVPEAGTMAGNMGGAGVLTVQAADRIMSEAEDLTNSGFAPLIRAGVPLSPQNYVDLDRASSTATSAANRATAAAAAQQAKNEYEAQKLELAKAGFDLRDTKSKDFRPLIVKWLEQEYDDGKLTPEELTYFKKRYREHATNPNEDIQGFFADFKAFMAAKTPGTPATPPPNPKPKGLTFKEAEDLPRNTFFTGDNGKKYFKDSKGDVYPAK
jgi:hypothetical protein